MFIGLIVAGLVMSANPPLSLNDGDRVVMIGSTLVEREQSFGSWELAMTLTNPGKKLTFRNLGWSGDTVYGESRNGFDNSPKGYERLIELTKELKPTVILVGYGQAESFDSEAGLPKFEKGLNQLLDDLASTNARMVLLTPPPFTKSEALPDPTLNNANLKLYAEVIRNVADKRKLLCIDLFEQGPFDTTNGMHLSHHGYYESSKLFGIAPKPSTEPLREAIVAKNRLFFYRWRPQNMTYLFGFRKHEQGQNAKDVAAFDPLVEAAEKQIQSNHTQSHGDTEKRN